MVFERLFDIIRFFFSLRFAKFLVLLVVLAALLTLLVGIVAGPFFLWLWLRLAKDSAPGTVEMNPLWLILHANDLVFSQAAIIETAWVVLIAGWGIWIGIKSYKRGVISRWRARRKEKREARRATKQASNNAREENR